MDEKYHKATFGGGCFWCIEEVFRQVRGVESVTSGYAGGSVSDPTYEQVSGGTTGHAEVVQIRFDPGEISFLGLLDIFWQVHDPTTSNRQGADVGEQYRSVIFYHDESQRLEAEESKRTAQESGKWRDLIVTQIERLEKFYPAEDYHQEYFRNHPEQSYCRLVIHPKIVKFQTTFEERRKNSP